MQTEEILKLRRKQLLYIYLLVTVLLTAFVVLITKVTFQSLLLTISIFFVSFAVFRWVLLKTRRLALTKDMRKLALYEKDLLGDDKFEDELKQSSVSNIFSAIGAIIPTIVHYVLFDPWHVTVPERGWWQMLAYFAIGMLLFTGAISWRMYTIHKKRDEAKGIQLTTWAFSLGYTAFIVSLSSLLINYL
ncbi:hypothetical protein [Halobacillus salinus]|uniref:hypothetical protein n=1 Tax=Halobacillus salinus TaxID=192814 RepID=UPI0009A64193|nr:hypothetical protein [Halobacillus salinus]